MNDVFLSSVSLSFSLPSSLCINQFKNIFKNLMESDVYEGKWLEMLEHRPMVYLWEYFVNLSYGRITGQCGFYKL